MALSKTQVSNLEIKKSGTQDNTIIASWDYPKSTTGDYAYFKEFKITWYYGYVEWKGTKNQETVWKTVSETQSTHSTIDTRNYSEFSIPQFDTSKVDSIDVYVEVTPLAKEKEVKTTTKKGKTKSSKQLAWEGKLKRSKTKPYDLVLVQTPSVPPTPNVKLIAGSGSTVKLEVSILGYPISESHGKSIEFQCRLNGKTLATSRKIDLGKQNSKGEWIDLASATYTSGAMTDGVTYEWRARTYAKPNCAGKHSEGGPYGDGWSDWSEPYMSRPKVPKGEIYIQKGKRETSNSYSPNIIIKDNENDFERCDGYRVYWSTDKEDLYYNSWDSDNQATIMKDDTDNGKFQRINNHIYARLYVDKIDQTATAIPTSNTVWISVQAIYNNAYDKYSTYVKDYSYYFTYIAGSKPLQPTIWSSKGTYIEDDKLQFFWKHNSTDGSYQTQAQIKFTINYADTSSGQETIVKDSTDITIVETTDASANEEKTYSVEYFNLNDFIAKLFPGKASVMSSGKFDITYAVRTMGHYTGESDSWSDWSPSREVIVYRKPEIQFDQTIGDGWLWDPFDFRYDTTETAYDGSPFPSTVTQFPLFIGVVSGPSPQLGMEYSYTITALQDYTILDYDGSERHIKSGEQIFNRISGPTKRYIGSDNGNYCLIRINAWDINLANSIDYRLDVTVMMDSGLTASVSKEFRTEYTDSAFMPDAEIILDEDQFSAYIIPGIEEEVELLPGEEPIDIDDVVFHIFRRNYDGTMTEIVSGLQGGTNISVVDPHPSLAGASYRIVGMSKKTGEIEYVDIPGQEFDEKPIIIQWDTDYQGYTLLDDWVDETEDPNDILLYGQGLQGNILKLPYNIDASNKYEMDKELVDYIGREHPVSYYGTQKGESLSLSTVIPKSSKDIIFALRKLSIYAGDCYIREPNGTGFWAHVTASFNINHLDVTVPVSIEATRVEGGI